MNILVITDVLWRNDNGVGNSYTNIFEGMANTLLECGAMGRPLITSNIHGCKEAVIDTKNGFLCEPQNANDLYQKMIKFINLPYENKIEMGKCSREHIAKNFNKIDVVDKTVKEIFN